MVRQTERSAATIGAILDAANVLFREFGYGDVTVDRIAARAGCRKGAFYHHFASKQALFERVLDDVQADLAVALEASVQRAFSARSARQMAFCIQMYLEGANQDSVRRILLIDGPVVLGWKRWREIDERHFAWMVRGGLSILMEGASCDANIDAATRLTLGAIMETALACSSAERPAAAASGYLEAFELMLSGFASAKIPSP